MSLQCEEGLRWRRFALTALVKRWPHGCRARFIQLYREPLCTEAPQLTILTPGQTGVQFSPS